jgi:phosphoribosylanthranilate isomerase
MPAEVKICGLSTPETLEAAIAAGADFVGLMFYAKSPRNVAPATAGELARIARGRARIVTVTVDADDDLIAAIATEVKPDFVQCHGAEPPERLAWIGSAHGLAAYKVLKVRDAGHVGLARAYAGVSPFVMFDALPPADAVLPGGNGLAFDWTILDAAPRPFMLAGGLTPGNVAEAIRVTGAAMVDVSSGVESAPGVKDVGLIRKFIEAARRAG